MTKAGLGVALAAALVLQVTPADSRNCYSKAEFEAAQAILFQTNLMVLSSACHDTSYGNFRLHNASLIIRYQHEMIGYFRHTGARQPDRSFETWITHLANQAAEKEIGTPTPQICREGAALLKQASGLNSQQFLELIRARTAVDPDPAYPLCK